VTAAIETRVREALATVMDPEIPVVSIADLGMVHRIDVRDDAVEIELLPTFVGCPAKDVIGDDAARAVREAADGRDVRIRFVYDPPWTTDRITERGRAGLREYGISPHWGGGPPGSAPGGSSGAAPAAGGPVPIPLLTRADVACPYCGSRETALEAAFGPTPCRTAHFCRACRNAFEGFKEKAAR
jgi:ring-1,2-phenylacetyl-CoA epoxidase subunit PaaD